jgi:hypothetical protein
VQIGIIVNIGISPIVSALSLLRPRDAVHGALLFVCHWPCRKLPSAMNPPMVPPPRSHITMSTIKLSFLVAAALFAVLVAGGAEEKLPSVIRSLHPRPIAQDSTVKYDYDIVYVRVPRQDGVRSHWAEVGAPHYMDPGGDLVLLHPDGKEELLVAGGVDGSIADPVVSFDGVWVYYAHFRGLNKVDRHALSRQGADIYRVHVPSRKIVRLTDQTITPNTGAADWSRDFRTPEKGKSHLNYGVINSAPCPLPGGKVMFTSNRNAFRPPVPATGGNMTLQLFVMDDDGSNVEQIGYLNLGAAMHPVVLKDGRVMFSSFEHQGLRGDLNWGLWTIHPDGTNWGPLVSAYFHNTLHFQTQMSDGSVVFEEYYNGGNFGFGTYYKMPARAPEGTPSFGPAYTADGKRQQLRHLPGVHGDSRYAFQPHGLETLTRFCSGFDAPARFVDGGEGGNPKKKDTPRVGKVTHPAGAPDNHLLTVYAAGGVNSATPEVDSGIYLLKAGQPINEPGELLLIKNDPKYNEQWPRALVPYKRIYNIDEPKRLPTLRNDGKLSKHLPEGTPFGLVGSSSLYKRESFPQGTVPAGSVTAIPPKHPDVATLLLHRENWGNQGSDAGLYANDDIWGIRILALEPTTDRNDGRRFYNHAKSERMRILGEIPVRKFTAQKQPLDPDGNPDTSFLARIPADVAWTFQTIDRHGMVLNMAQTWHQLRPGEIRNNCGGCHAHSQKPTPFEETAAGKSDYHVFDLTQGAPLQVSRKQDESGKQWDASNESGIRFTTGVKNVEYLRDVKPILERSCTACHTKSWEKPAGELVLDDDTPVNTARAGRQIGSYARLAADQGAGFMKVLFGHKPPHGAMWGSGQASRYVWKMQSRHSPLVWKLYGRRMDGLRDEDFTTEMVPGDNTTLQYKGRLVEAKTWRFKDDPKTQAPSFSVSYTGSIMPPPEAVAGTYMGPDGKPIKVAPLTVEDRRTIVRWIDLGCPIDLDCDRAKPQVRGYGWMCDDNRPTLALTYPRTGSNEPLSRLLVGMHDYYSGLDMDSFQVIADFPVDGTPAGANLAKKFKPLPDSRWEFRLDQPITNLKKGKLSVSVKDRQGNVTRIERTFSVGK